MLNFHQRTEPRKRTLLRLGRILGDQNLPLAECRFYDLSRSGARVELLSNHPLPQTFQLLDMLYMTVRDAEIAWRQGKQMGLRFSSSAVPFQEVC